MCYIVGEASSMLCGTYFYCVFKILLYVVFCQYIRYCCTFTYNVKNMAVCFFISGVFDVKMLAFVFLLQQLCNGFLQLRFGVILTLTELKISLCNAITAETTGEGHNIYCLLKLLARFAEL